MNKTTRKHSPLSPTLQVEHTLTSGRAMQE